jgi:hypothetical protein
MMERIAHRSGKWDRRDWFGARPPTAGSEKEDSDDI